MLNANRTLLTQYGETFNIDNPKEAKNLHMILLNDFETFRTNYPLEEQEYKKTSLMLKKRQMNSDFEKSIKQKKRDNMDKKKD